MPERHAPYLTATWRNLVLVSFEVDPGVLRPYTPAGVELDCWEGKHLVSLVGLEFGDVRVRGVPVPFHRSYPQVNLRFYVRRRCQDQWRRGVVFIRQIVPKLMVALVARWKYQEKYVALPMSLSAVVGTDGCRRVSYRWMAALGWNSLSVSACGEPQDSSPGSLEEFVAERYFGYNPQRNGSTLEYGIEHPRWRVQRAHDPELVCDVAGIYGPELVESLGGPPVSALLAEDSPAAVHRPVRL